MDLFIILGALLLLLAACFVAKEFMPKTRLPWSSHRSDADVKEMLKERLFLPKEVGSHRKSAPIAGRCYECGHRATMPYKCKFCGGLYCDKHRLPESHECEGLKRLKRDQDT